jgi:hypothetical protein
MRIPPPEAKEKMSQPRSHRIPLRIALSLTLVTGVIVSVGSARKLPDRKVVERGSGSYDAPSDTQGTSSARPEPSHARSSRAPAVTAILQTGFVSEYNVLSYGAVGDGTTDDTVAFESALQAAAKQGGTVYVPVGTYKIGNLVLPPTNAWVTLLMDGSLYLTQTLNINHGAYALVGRWGSIAMQHQQFPATPIYFAPSLNPVIRITAGPVRLQ